MPIFAWEDCGQENQKYPTESVCFSPNFPSVQSIPSFLFSAKVHNKMG